MSLGKPHVALGSGVVLIPFTSFLAFFPLWNWSKMLKGTQGEKGGKKRLVSTANWL